jgi:hypothetical protein
MVAPPRPALAPSVVLHDRANLVALPLIGTLVVAGLLGHIDTMLVSEGGWRARSGAPTAAPAASCCLLPPQRRRRSVCSSLPANSHIPFPSPFLSFSRQVTKSFILYIVADFFWILLEPKAVPSQPRIILWHHAITFLLLQIPLHHPQLGRYTCMVRGGGHAGGPGVAERAACA